MTSLSHGDTTLKKVCEALGIEGMVRRVVIDLEVDNIAKVYVEHFLDGDKVPVLIGELKRASDAGRVDVSRFDILHCEPGDPSPLIVRGTEQGAS